MKYLFDMQNPDAVSDGLPEYLEELTSARLDQPADVFMNLISSDEEYLLPEDIPMEQHDDDDHLP